MSSNLIVSFECLESIFHLYKSSLKRTSDALVVFVHWFLIKNGYKCLTEDGHLTEILPEGWNCDEQVYSIKYSKDSKGFELKILIVDENLLINLARLKDERLASVSVKIADHVTNLSNDFNRLFINLTDLYEKLHTEFEALTKTTVATVLTQEPKKTREFRPEPEPETLISRPSFPPPESIFPQIGRGDLDPFGRNPLGPGSGMIFDPFHPGYRPPLPGDLPRGAVPPFARFDPFAPPNPDTGRTRSGPNPNNFKPPGYDDMFM